MFGKFDKTARNVALGALITAHTFLPASTIFSDTHYNSNHNSRPSASQDEYPGAAGKTTSEKISYETSDAQVYTGSSFANATSKTVSSKPVQSDASYSINTTRKNDYSSYMNSLKNYCRQYGYMMPGVDDTDYNSALAAWNYVNAQWESEQGFSKRSKSVQNDNYDFVPVVYSDHSIIFWDQNGHGQVSATKMPNGLFRLSGPKAMVEAIGGRGNWDTIVNHLAQDENYFNDRKG